jgi:hypothetical protein
LTAGQAMVDELVAKNDKKQPRKSANSKSTE